MNPYFEACSLPQILNAVYLLTDLFPPLFSVCFPLWISQNSVHDISLLYKYSGVRSSQLFKQGGPNRSCTDERHDVPT